MSSLFDDLPLFGRTCKPNKHLKPTFRTFPHCGWPQLLSHGLLHVIPAIGGWFLTKKRGQHPRYKLTPGGLTQRVDLRITQVFNREFHMDNFRLNQQTCIFFRGCNILTYYDLEFLLLSLWKSLQLKLRIRKPKANITANITSLIVWNYMCSICRSNCFQNYFHVFDSDHRCFSWKRRSSSFFWLRIPLEPSYVYLKVLLASSNCDQEGKNMEKWKNNILILG